MNAGVVRTRPGDPALEDAPEVASEEALALPPDDPARRSFLLGVMVRLAEAYSSRDLEAILARFHPEAEVRISTLEDGGRWGGDFDETYEGAERLRAVTSQWLDPWESLRMEPGEVVDTGSDSFVMFAEWIGTGSGSGIEVRTPFAARVALSGDLIRLVAFFPSAEAAFADLGLQE
jgi:hypothetical protein